MNCPPGGTHRTISALCQRSRDISLEKGWLNPDGTDPRPFHTVIGLFHTELSEAFEEVRDNKSLTEIYYEAKFKESDGSISKEIVPYDGIAVARKTEGKYGRGRDFLDAKPCGIPIEFADFVIRVCQWAGSGGAADALQTGFLNTKMYEGANPDAELLITRLHRYASRSYDAWCKGSPDGGAEALEFLSDALCELFHFCEKNNIDLWAAIDEKEAYNRTRPIKHGGKKM
jgi:hypothetical protein